MKTLLFICSAIIFCVAMTILFQSESAVHEILSAILFLLAFNTLGFATLLEALHGLHKAIKNV